MTNGKLVPIKELYAGLYDGPHATPKPAKYGPIFLGIKNITDGGRFNFSDIRHISYEEYPRWTKRVKPTAGDIVFTYEATLNRYAVIPDGFEGCLGRRMALIRPDETRAHNKYLYYYFFSPEWRSTIKTNTLNGSTVDRIPLTRFPDFPVRTYGIATQRKIAGVLGTYDDLIENNSERIEKLEAMARLLYRHYFEVPESTDWEVVKIGDILGRTPKSTKLQKSEYLGEGIYPVIDQGKEYIAGYTDKQDSVINEKLPLTVFGDHTRAVKLAQDPFARGADGTQIVVSDILPPYYLYQTIKDLPLSNEHYARHFKLLKVTEIARPPESILCEFEAKVEPIFKLINALTKRNRNLAKARELLLPRLMSGEIKV